MGYLSDGCIKIFGIIVQIFSDEVEGDVLPGNTDIKIVAVITTDGGEPVQILLSQMKLQDRSLESIFNSAGQDILEQLSEKANGTNEDDTQSQESEE